MAVDGLHHRLSEVILVARNQRAHLIGAAKGRGPLVFAHIGVLSAAQGNPDLATSRLCAGDFVCR